MSKKKKTVQCLVKQSPLKGSIVELEQRIVLLEATSCSHQDKNDSKDPTGPLTKGEKISMWINISAQVVSIGIAVIYALQLIEMKRVTAASEQASKTAALQLGIMKLDQRPWISISQTSKFPDPLLPTGFEFNVVNTGKSPAASILVYYKADILRVGQDPQVDETTKNWSPLNVGIEFPGIPATASVAKIDGHIPNSAERNAFWIATWGIIDYRDASGKRYQTHYCFGRTMTGEVYSNNVCLSKNGYSENQ